MDSRYLLVCRVSTTSSFALLCDRSAAEVRDVRGLDLKKNYILERLVELHLVIAAALSGKDVSNYQAGGCQTQAGSIFVSVDT